MADLTVLTASKRLRLTKLFGGTKEDERGRVQGDSGDDESRFAKWYSAREVKVPSLRSLAGLLRELESDTASCIIRGQLLPDFDPARVRRSCRPGKDYPAYFEDVPRRWFCLDVDKLWVTREGKDTCGRDPDLLARWMLKQLPAPLDDASVVVQWSSSMGTNPGWTTLSAHLWFWLRTPVSSAPLREQVKVWKADGRPWLDPSTLSAAHVHFTAAPLFEGDWVDPLPPDEMGSTRVRLIEGFDPFIDFEDLQDDWDAAREAARTRRASMPAIEVDGDEEWQKVTSALEHLGNNDLDYDDFIEIGMAISSKWPGDEGLALWDRWSSGASKYEPGVCDYKWASFSAQPDGGGISLGTLFAKAKEAGWVMPLPESAVPTGAEPRASWEGPGDVGEPPEWLDAPMPDNDDACLLGSGGGSEAPPEGPSHDGGDGRPMPEPQGDASVKVGRRVYRFGRRVETQLLPMADGNGGGPPKRLGSDIWPVGLCADVDTGEHGLVLRCCTRGGREILQSIAASSWATKRAQGAASERLALAGVRVESGKGGELVGALGVWAERSRGLSVSRAVSRTGWYEGSEVFVQGAQIHGGENWIWTGPEERGRVRGSLERWKAQVAPLGRGSNVIALALGVAFAAPLVDRLGQGSFAFNLNGGSSTGKTLATRIAASVWQPPRDLLSWQDTGNYLMGILPLYSGQLVVIDDLRKAKQKDVAGFVLALSDNATKGRADRAGDPRARKKFALAGLSSGEESITSFLGDEAQGGHTVRAIDLRVKKGEATRDWSHAKDIERWVAGADFGVAGAAWAASLVGRDSDFWKNVGDKVAEAASNPRLLEAAGESTENRRIAYTLALVFVALGLAQGEGVCPEMEVEPEAALIWAAQRIFEERGLETCPEERCLRALLDRVERSPAQYPKKNVVDAPTAREVGGTRSTDGASLYVTEGQIKPLCKALKVPPRGWLAWLRAEGLSTKPGGIDSTGGFKARWHTIGLDKARRRLE